MLTDSPLAKLKTVSVDELLSEPLIVMRSMFPRRFAVLSFAAFARSRD